MEDTIKVAAAAIVVWLAVELGHVPVRWPLIVIERDAERKVY